MVEFIKFIWIWDAMVNVSGQSIGYVTAITRFDNNEYDEDNVTNDKHDIIAFAKIYIILITFKFMGGKYKLYIWLMLNIFLDQFAGI